MRIESLKEKLADRLTSLNIQDNSVIIITLPDKLTANQSQTIGQTIVDALRAINKSNPVIALPTTITMSELSEKDMEELGWIRKK